MEVLYYWDKNRLDKLYEDSDPWNVESPGKQSRNELVLSLLNLRGHKFHHGIDLCCGEGTITVNLLRYCDTVTGVDISENAIRTARAKYNSIEWVSQDCKEIDFNEYKDVDLVCLMDSFVFFNTQEKRKLLDKISSLNRNITFLFSNRLIGQNSDAFSFDHEFKSYLHMLNFAKSRFLDVRGKVVELDFFCYRGHNAILHLIKMFFAFLILSATKFSKNKFAVRCKIVDKLIKIPFLGYFVSPLIQQYAVIASGKIA